MRFEEPRLSGINYLAPESIYDLIVRDLCGERYHRTFSTTDQRHISDFLKMASGAGLTYERFNELLLLLDQDRVSKPFYKFFFSNGKPLELARLAQCVIRFRGFAMLCYGDFRFAYKDLSKKDHAELVRSLCPFSESTAEVQTRFQGRPDGALSLEDIPGQETWSLGYIAKKKYDKEAKLLAEKLKDKPADSELLGLAEKYEKIGEQIKRTQAKGIRNTDVYLTWDYMDVYVATSMRKTWEFKDVSDFVGGLFANGPLKDLKLRYFNPTQSDCASRIDKGLVEALMLKRALCTVYMVQESDTLGKDSELASTLAQGKPVIAYVPTIDVEKHAEKVKGYPLEYFRTRFRVLQAEAVFDDDELKEELHDVDPDYTNTVNAFLSQLNAFAEEHPFTLCDDKEAEFKKKSETFGRVCILLSLAERHNFKKRASILKTAHPLSLQVHLESGVANGVLVVRTVAECAEVLWQLLTNSLSFVIEFDSKQNCTLLKEKISQSPFRAVTQYEKLANSFWNFYLMADRRKREGK